MARQKALEQIDLFDKHYFTYYKKADLAMQTRRAGWKIGII